MHSKKNIDITESKNSRPEVYCKEGFLKNFAKFTGKHLRPSLFFNRLKRLWRRATLLKRDSGISEMLSCESCEIFKKTYFAEHLRTTAFESGAHLSSNFRKFFRGDKQISEYFESKL